MKSKIATFDDKLFLQKCNQKIVELKINYLVSSISKELKKFRSDCYEDYLEQTYQESRQEQLIKFFEIFEIKSKTQTEKFIEINVINNFNHNASINISRVVKGGLNGIHGDADVQIKFYDTIQKFMLATEILCNTLNKIDFYIDGISVQTIENLQNRSHEKISYSMSFKQMLLVLLFKLLKIGLKNLAQLAQSLAISQTFLGIMFMIITAIYGINAANMISYIQKIAASGLIPMFVIKEFTNPLFVTDKIHKLIDEKVSNLYIAELITQIERPANFLNQANLKFDDYLTNYIRIRSESVGETQLAFDQRIMITRLMESLVKGEDLDMQIYEDFIKNSDVQFKELGNGWVEIVE